VHPKIHSKYRDISGPSTVNKPDINILKQDEECINIINSKTENIPLCLQLLPK
jgi:hypothetical protein